MFFLLGPFVFARLNKHETYSSEKLLIIHALIFFPFRS